MISQATWPQMKTDNICRTLSLPPAATPAQASSTNALSCSHSWRASSSNYHGFISFPQRKKPHLNFLKKTTTSTLKDNTSSSFLCHSPKGCYHPSSMDHITQCLQGTFILYFALKNKETVFQILNKTIWIQNKALKSGMQRLPCAFNVETEAMEHLLYDVRITPAKKYSSCFFKKSPQTSYSSIPSLQ